MTLLFYAFAVYLGAFVILFCFPTLLHKKRRYKVCRRLIEGKNVKLIPHRGGLFENYENSFSAFAYCKSLNAFGVELDLHKTKDNQFVVLHDSNLLRITGQPELVEDLNYSEVKPYLDVINPLYTSECFRKANVEKERPPLFEDVLKLLQNTDMYINIDVKSNKVEDVIGVCKLISKYGYEDRVVIGFMMDQRCKDIMKTLNLDLPVFFNVQEAFKYFFGVMFGILPFLPFKYDFLSISGHFESMKDNPLVVDNAKIRYAFKALSCLQPILPLVHWHMNRRGIPVAYWILNTESDYLRAIQMGANAIMTDYPTKLKHYLAQKQLL